MSVDAITLDQLAHDPSKATNLPCEIRGRLLIQAAGVIVALSASGPTYIQTTKQSEAEEYLTLGEFAGRTDSGRSTIRGWVASGFLKRGEHYMGDGKKRRFFMRAITAYLAQTPPLDTSPVAAPVTPFVRKGRRHG